MVYELGHSAACHSGTLSYDTSTESGSLHHHYTRVDVENQYIDKNLKDEFNCNKADIIHSSTLPRISGPSHALCSVVNKLSGRRLLETGIYQRDQKYQRITDGGQYQCISQNNVQFEEQVIEQFRSFRLHAGERKTVPFECKLFEGLVGKEASWFNAARNERYFVNESNSSMDYHVTLHDFNYQRVHIRRFKEADNGTVLGCISVVPRDPAQWVHNFTACVDKGRSKCMEMSQYQSHQRDKCIRKKTFHRDCNLIDTVVTTDATLFFVQLIVKDPPNRPQNIAVVSSPTLTSLQLTWEAPIPGNISHDGFVAWCHSSTANNGAPRRTQDYFVNNSTFSVTLTDLLPSSVYNCSVSSTIYDQRSAFHSVRVSTVPLETVRLGLCEEWHFRCNHTVFNVTNTGSYTPWNFSSRAQPLLIRETDPSSSSTFVRIPMFGAAHNGLRIACGTSNTFMLFEKWVFKREKSENACRTCGSCPDNALCSATRRGMHCQCQPGYILDGSACVHYDACVQARLETLCPAKDTVCVRNLSSYSCDCQAGYERYSSGACKAINECGGSKSHCGAHGVCSDLPGSFSCSCSPGYDGCGASCQDVDECARGTHKCGATMRCVNTQASYTCTCGHGYTGQGNSSTLCTDIDECSLDQTVLANGTLVDLAPCPNNVTTQCKNTDGSYICPCLPGFEVNTTATSDGGQCQDADECKLGNLCTSTGRLQAECNNTFGSFLCQCPKGFAWNTTTRQCVDKDECALGENDCDPDHGLCTNTIGAFTCSCAPMLHTAGDHSTSRETEGNGVTCGQYVSSGSRSSVESIDNILLIVIIVLAVVAAILLCILFYLRFTVQRTVKEVIVFERKASDDKLDSIGEMDPSCFPDEFANDTWHKSTLHSKASTHTMLGRVKKGTGADELSLSSQLTFATPQALSPMNSKGSAKVTQKSSASSVHATSKAAAQRVDSDNPNLMIYSNPSLLSFNGDLEDLLAAGADDASQNASIGGNAAPQQRPTPADPFGLPPLSAFAGYMAATGEEARLHPETVADRGEEEYVHEENDGDSIISRNTWAAMAAEAQQVPDPFASVRQRTNPAPRAGQSNVPAGATGAHRERLPSLWMASSEGYSVPNKTSLVGQQGQDVVGLSAGQIVLKTLAGELVVATDNGGMYPLSRFNCILDPHSVAFYRVQASASGGFVLIDSRTGAELSSLSSSQVLDACKAFEKLHARLVSDKRDAIAVATSDGKGSVSYGAPRSLLSMPNGHYAFVNDTGASVPLCVFGVRVEPDRASRFAIASASDSTYTLFDVVLARRVGSVKYASVVDVLSIYQEKPDELMPL
ncbi:uncharacterized protein LOC135826628 [Sycon ciliatum]|uniref:uncharacterized protein LOC135826628 n=1 Tax=Sycon ciliatum TaxID=27933 RepID=UPI0031F67FA8